MKSTSNQATFCELADRAMREAGFTPEFPAAVREEVAAVRAAGNEAGAGEARDLTQLLWSSIDNAESRDLDQIEYVDAQGDGLRLLVGIADVDSLVPIDSAIDRHAAANGTSVYTGGATFPMLPEELSTDMSSLNEGGRRAAIVIDMEISGDGEVGTARVYRAWVCNHAKLVYEEIGDWLEGRTPVPASVIDCAGLEVQLKLQADVAQRLHSARARHGALDFDSVEAKPRVENGQVVDLVVQRKNLARGIIENFMIAANMAMAGLLQARGIPSIQRVVRTPERWDRIVEIAARNGGQLPSAPDAPALATFLTARRQADPAHFADLSLTIIKLLGAGEYVLVRSAADHDGHFGLAAHDYTHATAPNRRFVDLIIQRLLKASDSGTPTYGDDELGAIAAHCTDREGAARKVERRMRKVAAAMLFTHRVGEEFDAIVTGASARGIFVRTLHPPVEGMVVRGSGGMDVGERVRVRLLETDIERGYINFAGLAP